MNWIKSFFKKLKPVGAVGTFSPRAQQVLALARNEAGRLNDDYIGTEHLLLGLARMGQGVAIIVLQKMGLTLYDIRNDVEKQINASPDEEKSIGNFPYTPRTKRVLALAAKEAAVLHHRCVGTEHILLGILREGGGVAAKVLYARGIDFKKAYLEILKELDPNIDPGAAPGKPQ